MALPEDQQPLLLTQPEGAVAPRPRTTLQNAGGGESKQKKEARERRRAALAAMLAAAEGLPDLLASGGRRGRRAGCGFSPSRRGC